MTLRAAALPANKKHTYGYHRMQVLAALINGATLLLIAVEILREAWGRFKNPSPVDAGPMLVIAVIGLIVNLIVAFVLREYDHDDLNTRSAFFACFGRYFSFYRRDWSWCGVAFRQLDVARPSRQRANCSFGVSQLGTGAKGIHPHPRRGDAGGHRTR
ncbi:MAG: hypothetical protein DRI32_05020 [Chloroflexi bacterium]|nr:MAG: hypothetical protein DRI32_05020 [Chloroflexota bacterium]